MGVIKQSGIVHRLVVVASLSLLVACCISGCTVGPDFKSPRPAAGQAGLPSLPHATLVVDVDGGDAQRFAIGGTVASHWWELYQSPEITALVRQALRDNPNLEVARQSLQRAQELEIAEHGGLLPSVSAGVSQDRNRYAQAEDGDRGSPSYYSISEVSIGASYDFDLWGGIRRSVEASHAQVDYSRFELESAYLALTTDVVVTALKKSEVAEEIRIQTHIVELQEHWLSIVLQQMESGAENQIDVALQRSQVAQSKLTLQSMADDYDRTRNELAALMGKSPSSVADLSIDLSKIRLPTSLPVSIPSEFLEQRPDIRAAEAVVHAQTAMVGVAEALRLPNITIDASFGAASLASNDLFSANNFFWSAAAGIAQPIFDGGQLKHQQKAQEAAMRSAQAQWQGTVINAFRDLSNALADVQHDAIKLQFALDDETASQQSWKLQKQQISIGSASYLQVLAVERSYQSASLNLLRARTSRFIDTAILYQQVGGGWWQRQDVPALVAQ